jgi:hypothetical protein
MSQLVGGCVGLAAGVGVLFALWRLRDGYWWP